MRFIRQAVLGSVFLFPVAVHAQDAASDRSSALTVTAATSARGVRFVALGEAAAMRLELYSGAGNKVYDSGYGPGSVLDLSWRQLSNARPAEGPSLCVVTIKSLSGHVWRRVGALSRDGGRATLSPVDAAPLSGAQTSILEATRRPETAGEPDDALAILGEFATQAITALGHDGQDGAVTSTSGALTFRTGNVFTGRDAERMRITPDGRVGIGVDHPQVMLDVAGEIRARGGIQFDDGTVLSSTGAVGRKSASGEFEPSLTGTGTMNRVAKWTDSSGTIGDSTITETSGLVGIGTATPQGQLHIFGGITQDVFAGMGPNLIAGPAMNYGYAGGTFGRGAGFFNVRPDASAVAPNPSLRFMTANQQRLIITNVGRVGVGVSDPAFKLDVLETGADGLRVQTGTALGTVASFGDVGEFRIDAAGNPGGRFRVTEAERVGIGIPSLSLPGARLHVADDTGSAFRVDETTVGGTVAAFGFLGDFLIEGAGESGMRFVVKESGNVGIGVPAPAATLEVLVGGTTLADAWTIRSSARLKTNIQAIPSALDRVMALRGVTFDWRETGKHSIGFIAEEVGRVLPEAVDYEASGEARGLDYGKVSPLLVEAIKAQERTIVELRRQNEEQEARLAALERTLASPDRAACSEEGRRPY